MAHRHFYSSLPTPTYGKTEALSPLPGLTDKVSLLPDPREVTVVPSAGGTYNSIHKNTHQHTPSLASPATLLPSIQGILSGLELRATLLPSLAPTLRPLSSPGPQLLKYERLFSAVNPFPETNFLLTKQERDDRLKGSMREEGGLISYIKVFT